MTQINATHSLNMHSILEHGSNGLNGYFLSTTDFKDYTDLNTKKFCVICDFATPHFAPLGQRICVTKKVWRHFAKSLTALFEEKSAVKPFELCVNSHWIQASNSSDAGWIQKHVTIYHNSPQSLCISVFKAWYMFLQHIPYFYHTCTISRKTILYPENIENN